MCCGPTEGSTLSPDILLKGRKPPAPRCSHLTAEEAVTALTDMRDGDPSGIWEACVCESVCVRVCVCVWCVCVWCVCEVDRKSVV